MLELLPTVADDILYINRKSKLLFFMFFSCFTSKNNNVRNMSYTSLVRKKDDDANFEQCKTCIQIAKFTIVLVHPCEYSTSSKNVEILQNFQTQRSSQLDLRNKETIPILLLFLYEIFFLLMLSSKKSYIYQKSCFIKQVSLSIKYIEGE